MEDVWRFRPPEGWQIILLPQYRPFSLVRILSNKTRSGALSRRAAAAGSAEVRPRRGHLRGRRARATTSGHFDDALYRSSRRPSAKSAHPLYLADGYCPGHDGSCFARFQHGKLHVEEQAMGMNRIIIPRCSCRTPRQLPLRRIPYIVAQRGVSRTTTKTATTIDVPITVP